MIFAAVHSGGAIVALVLVRGPVLVVVPLQELGLRLESGLGVGLGVGLRLGVGLE